MIRVKKTYIILSILLVVGCSHKFHLPVIDMPSKYLYQGDEGDDMEKKWLSNTDINSGWWLIFGDTTLNKLIDSALINNSDAMIAFSKIERARLAMKSSKADFLPQLSLDISGERGYSRIDLKEEEFFIEPTVSWEISLFGAMKNSSRAARANLLAAEYNYRAVMLSLSGEIATSYFSLIQYRQSLEISKVTYKNRLKSMSIIDSLVKYGMSTSLDLRQSQGLTATAAAAIPLYQRAAAESQNTLSQLIGVDPKYIKTNISYREGDYKSLPAEIPAGIPADLLNNRPDIMEKYAMLMIASAKVGIAQSARLPSISLTAAGGVLSSSIKSLVSTDPYSKAWSSLLSITQPIFMFGKLKKGWQIAEKEYSEAEIAYKQSVRAALCDVSNALIANHTLRSEVSKYESLVESSIEIEQMTSSLYKEGLVDYLNLLDAERTLYSSQLKYSQLLAEYYSSIAKLFLSLGGKYSPTNQEGTF